MSVSPKAELRKYSNKLYCAQFSRYASVKILIMLLDSPIIQGWRKLAEENPRKTFQKLKTQKEMRFAQLSLEEERGVIISPPPKC